MIEVTGKASTAKIFATVVEPEAVEQVKTLCDQEFTRGSTIRLMPDIHAGKGCTIGTTMTIQEKVVPNLVGVDIGCGMETVELGPITIDYAKLDAVIRAKIPAGFEVHNKKIAKFNLQELHCYRELKNASRLEKSIGTLGGGNHFIEVAEDDENNKYLIVHSGSRNLGHQVASYYQTMAVDICSGKEKLWEEQEKLITTLKSQGKRKEIQTAIKKLKAEFQAKRPDMPEDLCYLTGEYKQQYLDDMRLCQEFARLNRQYMANRIAEEMGWDILPENRWQTVHNYIDHDSNILRKGAVSAKKGEKLLIPINMRDGSLICVGKGNPDWNQSAPHGAGRLMSRTAARKMFQLEAFKQEMQGIYTTSVNTDTLDECPMAYKNIEDIVDNIGDTVEVIKQIKPVYNFKASETAKRGR